MIRKLTEDCTASRPANLLKPTPFAIIATASLVAAVSLTCVARAAEPSSGSSRFSESSMLETARGTATIRASGPVNIGIPPPDELRVLEARREAELKRLSEKLKRAVEARGTQPAETTITRQWTTEVAATADDFDPAKRSGLGVHPSDTPSSILQAGGRATILMVMTPGDDRARDPNRGSDPILCVDGGCYVSNGAQAPATYHSFTQSLSLSGRLGRGAGECNHSNVCVFRNVDLGAGVAMVQPINLRFVRHDRREQREVSIDSSCRIIDARLSCSRPIRTSGYNMWVIPETLARDVGPEMLTGALATGLHTAQTAELPGVRR